jgi:hypothetical protein
LIRNPLLFRGECYLDSDKNYFEGWYFKNSNGVDNISFIPGISINNKKKCAFIQVITNNESYYFSYDIDCFSYNENPFYIKINDNYFSLDNIHIDINDIKQDICIYGDIGYYNSININTCKYSPNIMGLFSYVPFMECNHAIINMKNKVNGELIINDNVINFKGGNGYIEKDYGCSFPKSYIWCQGNDFKNKDASFMLSIADIPFILFNFKGIICSLIVDNVEYRFATYNNSKIVKYDVRDNYLNIVLKKGHYYLDINCAFGDGLKLVAPVKGEMNKDIIESITEVVSVCLKMDDEIIFEDSSRNCGLEIVYD